MNPGIVSAAVAAVCLAGYLVLNRKAGVDPSIGTVVVRAAGFVAALVIFATVGPKGVASQHDFAITGYVLVCVAGALIAVGDYFMFRAFASGAPVAVIGPIISAGAVWCAALGGMIFLGEAVTVVKVIGVIATIIGAVLLSI